MNQLLRSNPPSRATLPLLMLAGCLGLPAEAGEAPPYECGENMSGALEETICTDQNLSALDRKMNEVYSAAQQKAATENPAGLAERQRGWLESRDACEKAAEPSECLQESYTQRIAELQARYGLVPISGTFTYTCDDDQNKIIHARFYETNPPSLYAEYGEQSSVMIAQPSSTGAKYAGPDETTLWEHDNEALVTWGDDSPAMKCIKTPLIAPTDEAPGTPGG
ncbi:MliC family protein [Azotobacter salinestris]|uniref:MliC family protein n=1 Tax=Azotobacter salinestris TaxID=69964 RepID=UPI0032DED302